MKTCIFPNCIVPTGPPITPDTGTFAWSDPNAWKHYNYSVPSDGDNIFIPKGMLNILMNFGMHVTIGLYFGMFITNQFKKKQTQIFSKHYNIQ